VHPGVYALPGAPFTFERRLLAAVLAAGGRCVASHRAAAYVHGLPVSPRIEIAVPRRQRPSVQGATVHRTDQLPVDHIQMKGALPVTTPARTIGDLASVLPRDDLERVLDHALVNRRVTIDEIRAILNALSRRRGLALIRSLLAERPDGKARVESPLEQELHRLLREEGFRGWDPQTVIVVRGERYRVDATFPGARLALETDGYVHHSTRASWVRDHAKHAALVAAGWRVLAITQEDLRGGRARFVALLREALSAATAR
jgi:very-short-patch-repair endonuclease